MKNNDSLLDELKNKIDVLNEEVQTFFYRKPLYQHPTSFPSLRSKDYKTIIIRNKNELKKIDIAEKLIANMNLLTMSSPQTYDTDIPKFIKEYKIFIDANEKALLKGIEGIEMVNAKKMLNTPAFLNIIGKRHKFIKNELTGNLDKLKEQMDSTTTTAAASTATAAASTATAAPLTATSAPSTATSAPSTATSAPLTGTAIPRSRSITQRLKDLVSKPK